MKPITLYEKLWNSHIVKQYDQGRCLLYIDRHLVQEVSSPVAFSSLKSRGIGVRQPKKTLAMVDHVLPTKNKHFIADPEAQIQIQALVDNTAYEGITYFPVDDIRQGIVHVSGPELGFTLPGTTLVCGDSHTATHGAFGSLAFGIGASECEKVFATQCLKQTKAKTMRINFVGRMPALCSAKDLALAVLGTIGASGGTGYAIEYAGEQISALSMEGRMTLCNMTIEAGARVGLVAPDDTTFNYLKETPYAPKGDDWQKAVEYWRQLPSDQGAKFDREVEIDISQLEPMVTWGTSPEHVIPISACVPDPNSPDNQAKKSSWEKAKAYMQVQSGDTIAGTKIDKVFIGSCTNSRIEDLRIAASLVTGRKVAKDVVAIVVPGSGQVQLQAEKEGLDTIFTQAGLEWRTPGCSLCVAMNNDRLLPQERCASTSNRNFEGRQGVGGRTHLMSPAMAAAAAITGEITDVRTLQ
ncbi:3-isopropylmalate dehydratase large subunit [Paraglaciecola sp. 2405UD69-4]|uniref:3-isopropylmalate dehydratase large subunit n=1 Tax=Paraglaciecola sp. 2405UD69-4 TaxID=3391836 RepID=UPI0039C9974E